MILLRTIMRWRTDARAGTISVESTEGMGTAFYLTLSIYGPAPKV